MEGCAQVLPMIRRATTPFTRVWWLRFVDDRQHTVLQCDTSYDIDSA
jgi:hypothetical protein